MEVALIILDGWGIGRYWPLEGDSIAIDEEAGRDAIAQADTPVYDELLASGAVGRLRTDGPTVGLPEGYMGNSQVGHLTIGAGCVIEQVSASIERTIELGTLGQQPPIQAVVDSLADTGGILHLWGLLSDGGVHASAEHLTALVTLAGEAGIETVVHAVTDGRDTPPWSARRFLTPLQQHVDSTPRASIATVSGRYYAMDRDMNWQRTRRAYEAMVHGIGTRRVATAGGAVDRAYRAGESDEFIAPTVIDGAPQLTDGDGVLMANFRADRARQLTRMLSNIEPAWPFVTEPPAVDVVTMAEYDRTYDLPVVFESVEPTATLGSVVADAGYTQLRIAESEKYPHVTYFLNGGREVRYRGEHRIIVQSPDVPTYDRQPEMRAATVTDEALAVINDADPDVLVLNYANPDMVGHTGDFDAVVRAIETVDTELGRLLDGLSGSHVLVIADHGNAEDMGTPAEPHTAHTTNPVPCIYLAPDGSAGGWQIRSGGTLADVTPTLLSLLGLSPPPSMTGTSLLE